MEKNLVIFCIPLSGLGHMNATAGLCQGLQKRGHRIVVGVERSWAGYFLKYGFEEEVYDERQTEPGEANAKFWSDFFARLAPYLREKYEKNLEVIRLAFEYFVDAIKYSNSRVREIIESVKPDFIIQDHYVAIPAIVNSGIPYAVSWSANPLVALNSPNLPPIDSSEPLDDQTNWKRCTEIRNGILKEIWESFSKWMLIQGAPQLKPYQFQYDLKEVLNILLCPKVVFADYAKRMTLGDNYIILEHALRNDPLELNLPDQFERRMGKLIYVSMGSMASADVTLMQRLVNILSKSKHKFIFSLGANHDKYEIAENMWGQPLVPQLEVLKKCDLFITHGGNNSFTESLYFGVPMIIMPLFGDQHSNAQRVVEMKIGAKMNAFEVEEKELNSEIDRLINDKDLRDRLSAIASELRKSNSLQLVAERIEKICTV